MDVSAVVSMKCMKRQLPSFTSWFKRFRVYSHPSICPFYLPYMALKIMFIYLFVYFLKDVFLFKVKTLALGRRQYLSCFSRVPCTTRTFAFLHQGRIAVRSCSSTSQQNISRTDSSLHVLASYLIPKYQPFPLALYGTEDYDYHLFTLFRIHECRAGAF